MGSAQTHRCLRAAPVDPEGGQWSARLAASIGLEGAGLAIYGRMRLRVSMPQKTITSLKETKEWALQRMKSAGR